MSSLSKLKEKNTTFSYISYKKAIDILVMFLGGLYLSCYLAWYF